MPEFSDAQDFPRSCDHLHNFPLRNWKGLLFTAIEAKQDFAAIFKQLDDRIGFMAIEKFKPDESQNKVYKVKAHWALYCDNYLEGFHIPFVHNALNDVLDYSKYETVLKDQLVLQIGYANEGDVTFKLPEGHPDFGKNIAAYYYWVFPNLMLNFYPWGLSVNVVQPITDSLTQVSFMTYVGDDSKIGQGAGQGLDRVEIEDEAVVESVQRGLQSSVYKTGRFSPTRE